MSELPPTPNDSSLPADHSWQSALAEFVGTRIELIRLESQEAAKVAKKRTSLTIALSILATTAWLSFIAGIIGLADHYYSSITWWMAALAAAGIHAHVQLRWFVTDLLLLVKELPISLHDHQHGRACHRLARHL